MKKTLSLILFAAAVLAGCQKNLIEAQPQEDNSGEQVTIVAYLNDVDAAKLSLVDDVKLAWVKGDQIKIGNNKVFTVDSVDANNPMRAFFTGTAPTTAASYRAFYPAQSYSNSAGRFVLPGTQSYGLDNKVTNVNYMYAVTTDYNEIHFHNVCGLLAIDLKGEGTVSNIRVSADQYISGTLNGMSISETGALTYTGWYSSMTAKPAQYVDLGCGKVATLSKDAARRFYIAVPEADYTNLKLDITTDRGTMVVPATKTASVKKNNIYHLPEMTVTTPPITFDFTQSGLTHNSVTYTVTPSLSTVNYYTEVLPEKDLEQFGNVETYASALLSYYLNSYPPATIIKNLMTTGTSSYSYPLDPQTDYVVIAFAVDSQCNIISDVAAEGFTSLEFPYVEAAYEDYLGKWIAGGRTIIVSEKVKGSTYNIEGLTFTAMGNMSAPVEAIYSSTAKCLTLSEQFIGTYNHPSYGECNEYLSGIFSDPDGSTYVAYPFNTDEMEVIMTAWKTKEGDIVWEGNLFKYGIFSNIGTSTVIQTGVYAGNGFKGVGISLPQTLEKAPEADDAYLKWIGTWQTEGGRTIEIKEAVANQSFVGIFDEDLANVNITIPYSDGSIQLNSQFLGLGSSSYGRIATYLAGCMWYEDEWSFIPDEYTICTAKLNDGDTSFSFSKGTFSTVEIGAITYGALIIEGDYAGYSLTYSDVTPLELPATFTKVQPVTATKKAFTGNCVLGSKLSTNNYIKFKTSNNQEPFAKSIHKEGSKIKKASIKDLKF